MHFWFVDAMKYASPAIGSLLLAAPALLTMFARHRRQHRAAAELRSSNIALQRRVAALEAQLETMQCGARDIERERDEFLATLSHELRSPLNAILGWIELLRVHIKDAAQQAHAIDIIERNARAEVRVVSDLLDMARLVTRRLQIARAPVSLENVVREAAGAVADTAARRGIALHVDASSAVPAIGDRGRLLQVVAHLLGNAIKFTERGGAVRVTVAGDRSQAIMRVADTGIGIAPDMLSQVFEGFLQAERGLTRRYGGLGLGLAIVKRLVELHGGTVEAASGGPGRGATFTVRLPRAGA